MILLFLNKSPPPPKYVLDPVVGEAGSLVVNPDLLKLDEVRSIVAWLAIFYN